MKRRWPPKVFATSHAVSAAYGLLCKIATPGQDVRASGTHGMDAVCTAVAWIVVDFRRLLAALSACDRNKNSGRADLLLRYSNYLHINHITVNNNISPPQTGICAKQYYHLIPYVLYFFTMSCIICHLFSISATSLNCVRQRSRFCPGLWILK